MKLSLITRAWRSSTSVHQLVHLLTTGSQVTDLELPILYEKLHQFISRDAKSNAVLLLVAKRYSLDVNGLVSKIDFHNLNELDSHMLYRALSECGCGVDAASLLFEKYCNDSSRLAILNFTSGYFNFMRDGYITPNESTVKALLARVEEHLHLFNDDEVLDLACCLIVPQGLTSDAIVCFLEQLIQKLRDASLEDLAKFIDFTWNIVRLTTFDAEPLVVALHRHLDVDLGINLNLSVDGIVKLLYILSKHYHIRPNAKILDVIAIQIRRLLHQFTLEDVSQVVVWLSKLSYSNASLLRILAGVAKSHLKENAFPKTTTVANLYTGFSRLGYKSLDLYKLLGQILQNDVVLQELQMCDLVNIVRAHARIHWVNESLFRNFERILLKSKMINATVATRLLIAHGKLGHENKTLHNHLIEAIDFEAMNTIPVEAEKLKVALNRLGIFCPELGEDENAQLPRIAFKSTAAPMRRLQHVRKLKWVW